MMDFFGCFFFLFYFCPFQSLRDGLKYYWSQSTTQATDIDIDLYWYWSSHMTGAWAQTQWTLFYFPVCPCLCCYSVTSTPWAEGPPSSPVELWVSLSPFITHYLSIASWVISLWVLWWVEPSRSETPSISALCLSTRSCSLSYFSHSPSITHPPLMIRVHLLPHSVAHPSHGREL